MPPVDEIDFRAHIRDCLLDYVHSHITVDYRSWSSGEVTRVLSQCISTVPLVEKCSIYRLAEPFDVLYKVLHLHNLDAYDEGWSAHREGVALIRSTFSAVKRSLRSMVHLLQDEELDDMHSYYMPDHPVLTRESTKNSLKLGIKKKVNRMPEDHIEMVKMTGILRLQPQDSEPKEVVIDLETCLNLRPTIDQILHRHIVQYMQTIPALTPAPRREEQSSLLVLHNSYELADADFLTTKHMTPPVFSRLQNAYYSGTRQNRNDSFNYDAVKDLLLLPSASIESDCEFQELVAEEQLRVADGSHAFAPLSSPSSLDTLSFEDDATLNDFLISSSPERLATGPLLADAGFDTILVPRSREIGSCLKMVHQRHSLLELCADNIPSFLSRLSTSPQSRISSPRSSSTYAWPPSNKLGAPENSPSEFLTFDDTLVSLYSDIRKPDASELNMKDEVEQHDDLFMEVPLIAGPNHNSTIRDDQAQYPSSLTEFLAHKPTDIPLADDATFERGQDRDAALTRLNSNIRFLKKAKGIPALNVELSWRPFTYGRCIPTNEEVSQANTLTTEETLSLSSTRYDSDQRQPYAELETLLCHITAVNAEAPTEQRSRCFSWDNVESSALPGLSDITETAATRADRTWLTENSRRSMADVSSSEGEEVDDEALDGNLMPVECMPPHDLLQENVDFAGQRTQDDAANPPLEDIQCDTPLYLPEDKSWFCLDASCIETRHLPDIIQTQGGMIIIQDSPEHSDSPPHEFPSRDSYSSLRQTFANCSSTPTPGLRHATVESTSGVAPEKYELQQTLCGFMQLRAVAVEDGVQEVSSPSPSASATTPSAVEAPCPVLGVPEEVLDNNTLQLADDWTPTTNMHRYLASMGLVQKTLVARFLQSHYAVALIERRDLGGVDLILDHHTAVVYVSLPALPSDHRNLLDMLTSISWRYSHVLVVFEAFPPSCLYKARDDNSGALQPRVFSAPVVRAIKKLRRDLAIASACNEKRPETNVHFSFAQNAKEAAKLARAFGDLAEAADATGVIWGDRDWLGDDEREGETELASVQGMNALAANIILSQTSLQSFLRLTAQERMQNYGALLGPDRIAICNGYILQRVLDTDLPPSSPWQTDSSDSSDIHKHGYSSIQNAR